MNPIFTLFRRWFGRPTVRMVCLDRMTDAQISDWLHGRAIPARCFDPVPCRGWWRR